MINISKVTAIHMKVAGLDYSYQSSDAFKFEAGVKGTSSEFENDVKVLFTQNGTTATPITNLIRIRVPYY